MILTARLSCSGDGTEGPTYVARSAEKLWTITSAEMARTNSLCSEVTGQPLKRWRVGNISRAAQNRMDLFTYALSTYSEYGQLDVLIHSPRRRPGKSPITAWYQWLSCLGSASSALGQHRSEEHT